MATDNKDKVLNVPNLRFPGFTEEWESTKIGYITSKVGSGVTPRGGSAVYKTAGHLFIRSQNVGNGCFLLDDVAYIDETTHKRQINTELKEGDVLLNITGASIGRSTVVDSSVAGGNVNQHVCIIRLKNNISPNFICNYLLSYGGQKQIDSFQAGGNREGLNFEQIRSIKFSIPSFEEQCKIATLLSLLDRRITTQIKIIEDLKKLKSAISANLFMNNDWEQYSIGDLCNSLPVKSYICPSVSEDGAYPIIQQGDNPIVGYTKSKPFKTYNDVVLFGDHTLSIYRPNTPFLLFTDGLKILERKALVTRDFLYYLLYFYRPKSEGYKRHYSILKDIYVPVPTIKKQKQISAGLLNVDIKIDRAEKIEKLYQKQKQYLLAQMFI